MPFNKERFQKSLDEAFDDDLYPVSTEAQQRFVSTTTSGLELLHFGYQKEPRSPAAIIAQLHGFSTIQTALDELNCTKRRTQILNNSTETIQQKFLEIVMACFDSLGDEYQSYRASALHMMQRLVNGWISQLKKLLNAPKFSTLEIVHSMTNIISHDFAWHIFYFNSRDIYKQFNELLLRELSNNFEQVTGKAAINMYRDVVMDFVPPEYLKHTVTMDDIADQGQHLNPRDLYQDLLVSFHNFINSQLVRHNVAVLLSMFQPALDRHQEKLDEFHRQEQPYQQHPYDVNQIIGETHRQRIKLSFAIYQTCVNFTDFAFEQFSDGHFFAAYLPIIYKSKRNHFQNMGAKLVRERLMIEIEKNTTIPDFVAVEEEIKAVETQFSVNLNMLPLEVATKAKRGFISSIALVNLGFRKYQEKSDISALREALLGHCHLQSTLEFIRCRNIEVQTIEFAEAELPRLLISCFASFNPEYTQYIPAIRQTISEYFSHWIHIIKIHLQDKTFSITQVMESMAAYISIDLTKLNKLNTTDNNYFALYQRIRDTLLSIANTIDNTVDIEYYKNLISPFLDAPYTTHPHLQAIQEIKLEQPVDIIAIATIQFSQLISENAQQIIQIVGARYTTDIEDFNQKFRMLPISDINARDELLRKLQVKLMHIYLQLERDCYDATLEIFTKFFTENEQLSPFKTVIKYNKGELLLRNTTGNLRRAVFDLLSQKVSIPPFEYDLTSAPSTDSVGDVGSELRTLTPVL